MVARSILWLVLIVGAAACGGPSAPVVLTRSTHRAPPVDRGQLAWDGISPGEYLIHDATLVVSDAAASTDVHLMGEWRALFLDDGRARVSIGSAEIEGRLRAPAERLTCTRAPLRFERGGLVVDVPRGGRLSVLGRSGRLARVGTPLVELVGATTLVEAETLSLDACAALLAPAGVDAVPARPSDGAACVFGGPTPDAERAWLPDGTRIEIGERRGGWAAVRAHMLGARVEGWTPVRALEPLPSEGERWVRTTAPRRIGSVDLPAGTVGRLVSRCRPRRECPEEAVDFVVEREGRWINLRPELASVEVEPTSAPALLPPRPFPGLACVYPDSPAWSREAGGSLPREAIRRVIQQHIGGVRQCYEARLGVRPSLTGRVMATFIIGPTGRVDFVGTSGSIDDGYVRGCIAQVVRGIRFPEPENDGVVGVNYPFILTSSP